MTTLEQAVMIALQKQAVFKEDKKPELAEAKAAQLAGFARAIALAADKPPAPVSRKDWAAMLIVVAGRETHFSLRLQRGECFAWECDRGRARGPWQPHKNLFNAPVWDKLVGLEFVDVQARAASDALGRGFWTCNPQRTGVADWRMATINGYAGHRCGEVWDGLKLRVSDWVIVRRQLG
jgi:hypothetical protein